jgi:Flp pilus assembly pilin Flp
MFEIMSWGWKMKKLMRVFGDEEGLAMIEYGLIAALIGVSLIITLGLLTNAIQDMFNIIISTLNSA